MRRLRQARQSRSAAPHIPAAPAATAQSAAKLDAPLPPLGQAIFVISGLPRSGTSMLMQMLAGGGMEILTDRVREADEDNPRGYFEFEAAKKMLRDQTWIGQARGKAVKIVAPLVSSLPIGGGPYRVVLIERDFDEILESQAKMIARRGESIVDSPERRERLKREYARMVAQTRNLLSKRADVELLILRYDEVLCDPAAARQLSFFAGGLNEEPMLAAIDRSLHRNRA